MNRIAKAMVAAASLVLALAGPTAHAGAVLDRVLASKTLTVAVGTDWGQMSFLNSKHELDGCDIDIAKEIAKHLGVQIKFVTPGWDLIVAGKWQGRWDMAMGQMVPTKARAEKLNFPAVYYYGPQVVVVHKDSKAAKLADLNGKVVGVAGSTVAESYANQKLETQPLFQLVPGEVKAYATTNVAFDDLRLGNGVRLDAVVTDGVLASKAIKSGYPLKQLGVVFFNSGAISAEHGDKEFGDKIAAAVKGMRDDGTLSKLSIKWYGEDFSVAK